MAGFEIGCHSEPRRRNPPEPQSVVVETRGPRSMLTRWTGAKGKMKRGWHNDRKGEYEERGDLGLSSDENLLIQLLDYLKWLHR
jgi:hypothetical protein